jgi:flagellar FliJ protein
MKFKFQFENVLKHRKTLEDLAERDFHEAQSAYLAEVAKLENLHEQVKEAHQSAFRTQVKGGSAAPALSQVHEFLKLQDVRIEHQQLKVQEFEKIVENLREILRQKAIDYKIIESLKDRKAQEFRRQKNKIEQKKSDEQTTMRHLNNVVRLREK